MEPEDRAAEHPEPGPPATGARPFLGLLKKTLLEDDLFDTLFTHSPVGIAFFALDGTILKANEALTQMLGYSEEELVGKRFTEVTHPDDIPENMHLFRELVEGDRPNFRMEKRYLTKSGQTVWGTLNASVVRGPGGKPELAVLSMIEDITARKRTEEALAESQEDYRRLVEMSPEPIAVHQDGRVVYVNPAAVTVLRGRPEQIIGKPVMDFVHPDDRGIVAERLAKLNSGQAQLPMIEERFLRLDGTAVDVEVTSGLITYQGRPGGQVIFRDITERKRLEAAMRERSEAIETEIVRRTRALHESEARFRAVFENASVGIGLANLDGAIMQCNQAFQDMLGFSQDELKQLGVFSLSHPADIERERLEMQKALAGEREAYQIEKRFKRKENGWMWAHVTVSLMRDDEGTPQYAMAILVDITDRKQREQALEAQMARMAELDRLKTDFVSMVSHELRTPLTSIMGYAEFLEDQVAGGLNPEQQAFVEQIREGSLRLRRLVDDLLDFARLEAGTLKLSKSPADLAARVREVCDSLAPQLRAQNLTIETVLPPGPLELSMDADRVGQVLLNLIGNAMKFTPAGGRLLVSLTEEAGHARVEVADTGIGIALDHLPRLFDRFFQVENSLTREQGGAGLGLAISKAIVEAHGGTIGAESVPGKGSTFWFTLPLGR